MSYDGENEAEKKLAELRKMLSEATMQKVQTIVTLVRAYEVKIPTPQLRHCSHGSVLVFTADQIVEINRYGTCSLAPFAMLELEEALRKRGN